MHYRGQFVYPEYWDHILRRSTVRVTFTLQHVSTAIDKHVAAANVSHVLLLDPFGPVSEDMFFGVYIDDSEIEEYEKAASTLD